MSDYQIFISHSGNRSTKVANLLSSWIPNVIHYVSTFISPDIPKGKIWFDKILEELNKSQMGIICLTMENKDRPWILFEAGALANKLSFANVCPVLIDLNSELKDPLHQFNYALPDKDSIYRLLKSINEQLVPSLKEEVLKNSFNLHWPNFETTFKDIMSSTHDHMPKRDDSYVFGSSVTEQITSHDETNLDSKIENAIKNILSIDDYNSRERQFSEIKNELDKLDNGHEQYRLGFIYCMNYLEHKKRK